MLSVIILAGGQGKRLGMFKPLIKLGNRTLIEWILLELKNCTNLAHQVIISVKNEEQENLIKEKTKHLIERENSHSVILTRDSNKESSPLLGIIGAIEHVTDKLFFVCGSDQPFLNCELIKRLYSFLGDFDAVVPQWENGYIEPLTAIYVRKKFESAAQKLLAKKSYSLHKLVAMLNTKFVSIEEDLNDYRNSFININTEKDLEFAENLIKKKER